MTQLRLCIGVVTGFLLVIGSTALLADEPVSYANDVRPILAENCFGCHQPARSDGDLVMTQFDKMFESGASGEPAIVAGASEESYLVEVITPVEGKAQMPPDGDTLSDEQVDTIRQWIKEGAVNDYKKTAFAFDAENPPAYSRLPVIASMDYSPDGSLLAMTGFHEVLLIDPTVPEGKILKRLVGLSSRIESVKFSPDGTRLAASGGNPGEFGEVQVWNVKDGVLLLSKPVSHDTVYGIDWSPDGKLISFGCTDTTLRAIDSASGEQVFFQNAHEDWVRDTVFSPDGTQLVSVGRDMSCKANEVKTQRFIDNITSITPGVLKGGIASVARHPKRGEVVIGGSDGIPKVYRINRITKRRIGDDANLVRLLPKMPGRIHSVDVSADGKRIAAGSSLNGIGHISVFSYEFDPAVSEELKAILSRLPSSWSKKEREMVDAYNTADVKEIAKATVHSSSIYAVRFTPDGKSVAAAGGDGIIRVFDAEAGNKPMLAINPVPVNEKQDSPTTVAQLNFAPQENVDLPSIPNVNVTTLKVFPEAIHFTQPSDYAQLVVQGVLDDGSLIDLSQIAKFESDSAIVRLDGSLVQPAGQGTTKLTVKHAGSNYSIPVKVDEMATFKPNFTRDVNPVLTKLGCNAGTCHGSATGKMGFKLSLRGYDPIFDIRSFTDDMGSRRTNLASPAESLMLLKPTASIPHQGGQLIKKDSRYYRTIHDWIRDGAKLDLKTPKVTSVEVFPKNPVLLDADWQQQMRIVATYSDGRTRDVTREGFLEVSDIEIAAVNGSLIKALRRGETSVLVRYEGAFSATTITVMGNRDGFAWKEPETWGPIDELVADKWERMKILPSELCTDEEFIRRVYLDLTGLPPSVKAVDGFLADNSPTKDKRDELVDKLIGNDEFIEHWSNKWADLLQVNRKYLGVEGAKSFRSWIRKQVADNVPYDKFAFEILTASGSNRTNPPASYFKIHRTPEDTMENTTHLFLATRFNCNKCHDHPFERWTQDQYYETAAYFARVRLKRDPESKDKKIGGSAVEGAKPLYEFVSDVADGDVKHDRTGEVTNPVFPFECDHEASGKETSRRTQLASWITSPDNPYFATSYVNRLWGYMLGVGLIEPLDDIRAGNPASNPQLLELLRKEFVDNNFDTRHIMRMICKSRTYQLSIKTNDFNEDDTLNYSHAMARRLPAEVLFDSIHFVTESQLMIPGVEPGTRAAELSDSGAKLPSGFLSTLGRPVRESACECERANDLQLGSVLALVSGPDLSRAIADNKNVLVKLVENENDDRKIVNQLYLRILNRKATTEEIDAAVDSFKDISVDHNLLVSQRDRRKTIVDEELPARKKAYHKAIADAQNELDATIKRLDPDLPKKEKLRAEKIAASEKKLKDYVADKKGQEQWQQSQQTIQWHPILPSKITSKSGRELTARSDRTISAAPKNSKDVYTIETFTELTGISSVRLEVLADESLPKNGPGLASNGNFVLTEFEMEIAQPSSPDEWKKVEFERAVAFFEQPDYPVKNSIDGKVDRSGWATNGNIGKTNWVTFQLKMPSGFTGGSRIRFRMKQNYDGLHQIGLFRISLTTHAVALGSSLSEELLAELSKSPEKQTAEIKMQLTTAFEKSDLEYYSLTTQIAAAKKPLVIDKEIVQLRERLERVSRPFAPDALLSQLDHDVALSEKQLANRRLTAVQDLAWALMNSPSFLFNR